MDFRYLIQAFEDENVATVDPDTNMAADFAPAISIDFTNRLAENIKNLQKALGITQMTPMAAGTQVKRYRTTATKKSGTVAEGEVIPLSKVTRVALDPIEVVLNKWRKQTTIEAIQKVGSSRALNEADQKLIAEIRKEVKTKFFAMINAGSGTATAGVGLQAAAANAWGALSVYYEDMDVTPVFFLHPLDVANYLGSASITTQTAFGMDYIENFLGLGNAFINSGVTQGTVKATATQNLNGVYVPAGGDVAEAFGLTFDEVGLVGMTHSMKSDNATIDSLIVSGVTFFPEDASGIFSAAISNS